MAIAFDLKLKPQDPQNEPVVDNRLPTADAAKFLVGAIDVLTGIATGKDPLKALQKSISGALIGIGLDEMRKSIGTDNPFEDLLKTPRK